MNTPRTALEELKRAAADMHDSLTYPGFDIGVTERGEVEDLLAIIDEAGKALSDALGGWLPIETVPTGCFVMAISRLTGRVMPLYVLEEENDLAERFTHWHKIVLAEAPTSANGGSE